jgi:hypothetical protein
MVLAEGPAEDRQPTSPFDLALTGAGEGGGEGSAPPSGRQRDAPHDRETYEQ